MSGIDPDRATRRLFEKPRESGSSLIRGFKARANEAVIERRLRVSSFDIRTHKSQEAIRRPIADCLEAIAMSGVLRAEVNAED
jgi:hypothetical protein